MVSRALPTTLARSLRSAVRRSAPLRSLATAVPFTEITTLSNGLTVATEAHAHAQTATVGVWIGAGTRAETETTYGTSGFLELMTLKGTARRAQHEYMVELENLGASLDSFTSPELTAYYAKCFRKDVPQAVDIIADLLQNFKLESAVIEEVRAGWVDFQKEVSTDYERVVTDHLHEVAYPGQALGRNYFAPNENIHSIDRDDLTSYFKTNHTADHMVLVGVGAVDHGELVKAAEKSFGTLPVSANPVPLGQRAYPKANFAASEVRICDYDISAAHIAMAVEGVSWSSPDYYPMCVMQNILGIWDNVDRPFLDTRLSNIIAKHNLAIAHKAFSTSYTDTGLCGIHLASESLNHLDDLLRITLREWTRMGIAPTTDEVEHAKNQLELSKFLYLDSTMDIAEDIGRQLVRSGRRATPEQITDAIDAVTPDDIKRVAQKYLFSKDIAFVALGPIENVPDYDRIRADMASML